MSVQTFTKAGAKASVAAKLPKEIFELEVTNHELVKAAYTAYLANGRENLARTKTRGDVSGGGKKPWRQKGTGRARFGSTRVPIWRKGGVAHGPTGLENYSHNITTGMKRTALKQALSLKTQSNGVVVVESLESKEGKTKDFVSMLAKLGAAKNVLIVSHEADAMLTRATANIGFVKLVRTRALNTYDVMNASMVILTKGAVDEIGEWLGGTK
jgi:large subunit ribosomal protein L4